MTIESLAVQRPTFSYDNFDQYYESKKKDRSIRTKFRQWRHNFHCNSRSLLDFVSNRLPVLKWLPKYKKDYLFGDTIAAATVGVVRVPQGMAYALLASVPPVYGLYSCFFPVILWFFFSTSKHTSVGTNGVICLMISNLIGKYFDVPGVISVASSTNITVDGVQQNISALPSKYLITDSNVTYFNMNLKDNYTKDLTKEFNTNAVALAMSASFIVGIIQLIMFCFRLGFLTTLLPDPVIQGFTTGASFHVAMSQAKYLFGLSTYVKREPGFGELFVTSRKIFNNLGHTNVVDLIISLVSLPMLLLFKHINQKYKKQLRNVPIPIEFFLIVIATTLSGFLEFEDKSNVSTVHEVPLGFEYLFKYPKYMDKAGEILKDCVVMALISVAVSLSLTKIYSDKHDYDTDANQEIFSLGFSNTVSSFVGSFAVAASLSRTAIQESAGGKTQLVSILSSTIMLCVLLFMGSLFEPVPKSVLACIIISALKSFFMQFSVLPNLYRVCKTDFVVWIVTCSAVVIVGVDNGLFIGMFFAIAVLLYRLQHPKHGLLGRITNTDLYANVKKYPDATQLMMIKIFHFADSISYTNKDAFRKKLYQAVRLNPSKVLQNPGQFNRIKTLDSISEETSLMMPRSQEANLRNRNVTKTTASVNLGFKYLVIDATMWSFVDTTACKEIISIVERFNKLNVTVMFAGMSPSILRTLDNMKLFESGVKKGHVFITLHDCVLTCERLVRGNFANPDTPDSMEFRPGYPGFDSLAL